MRWQLALLVALVGCTEQQPPSTEGGKGCEVSTNVLDFGEVEGGSSRRLPLTVTNWSNQVRELDFTPTAPPFLLGRSPPRIRLQSRGAELLEIHFTPNDGLLHLGEIAFSEEKPPPYQGSCDFTVSLHGLGAGGVSLEPPSLQFDPLVPGEVATRELVLHNSRRAPITFDTQLLVEQFISDGPNFVTLSPASGSVPALGSVVLTLSAAPEAPAVVNGAVVVTSRDLPIQLGLSRSATFRATAGKPVAEVIAEGLNPWRVAYDVGSQPPSFSQRRITIRNVGSSGDVEELALKLGQPGFLIEAIQGSPEELWIGFSPELSVGLGGGKSAALVLQLSPLSPGPKEFRVRIFLNDPTRPEVVVMVRAVAESMPACSMTVQPTTNLQLTPVSDGGVEGSVTFTNSGLAPCIVDDVRISNGTIPGYTIVSGGAPQVELLSGDAHVVTIAGPRPPAPARLGGLEFHVFNAHSGIQNVSLLWQ